MSADLIERLRAHAEGRHGLRMQITGAEKIVTLLVEKNDLLREAAAALEAEASEAGCMCRGVEIGSHMASVSLPIPEHMADYRAARVLAGLSPMISVDACLVVELRLLWARGIRTYGSCCGHNKVRGMVNVHEDDAEVMREMGYAQWPEKDGMAVATFYPKSVRGLASEGERRGLERVAADALALSCDDQFALATNLASNIGYELAEEPLHPDTPKPGAFEAMVERALIPEALSQRAPEDHPRYPALLADARARGRNENLDGSPRRHAVAKERE